ncbi:MAG: SCO family protein [Methylophilaceae bacterium]
MRSNQAFIKVSPFLVIAFWLVVFFSYTDGFKNFTQEAKRKTAIFQQQPDVAFLRVMDDAGNHTNLSVLAKSTNKTLIAEFIYTRCTTLCLSLGGIFQQVQTQILQRKLSQKVGLVSISFDVDYESQQTLKSYRNRMIAQAVVWDIVKMQDQVVLEEVKNKLGLVVIKDQQKNLIHNSAFLIINSSGKIVGIFEPAEISAAITLALKQTHSNLATHHL